MERNEIITRYFANDSPLFLNCDQCGSIITGDIYKHDDIHVCEPCHDHELEELA